MNTFAEILSGDFRVLTKKRDRIRERLTLSQAKDQVISTRNYRSGTTIRLIKEFDKVKKQINKRRF